MNTNKNDTTETNDEAKIDDIQEHYVNADVPVTNVNNENKTDDINDDAIEN